MDHPSSRPHHSDKPLTARLSRATVAARLTSLRRGMISAAIAYLLGGCPLLFGVTPLGIAFLCASSRYTWYIVGGLVLSAWFGNSPAVAGMSIVLYALILLLRLAVLFFIDSSAHRQGSDLPFPQRLRAVFTSPITSVAEVTDEDLPPEPTPHRRLFTEAAPFRVLIGAVGGLVQGIFTLVRGGFAFYDLWGALFSALFVPVAVFLLIPFFHEDGQALFFTPPLWDNGLKEAIRSRRISLRTVIAITLVMEATVYAAGGYVLTFGSPYITLRLAPLLAILLSLRTASRMGLIPGLIISLPLGMCISPILSPAYLLAVLVFGVLGLLSLRLGTVGGVVSALGWCALVGGTNTLAQYFITFLLAIPLFLIMEHLHDQLPQPATNPHRLSRDFSDAAAHAYRAAVSRERLGALSDAFSSLSSLFYDMSDRLRHPRLSDVHRMCEEIISEACSECTHCAVCRHAGKDGAQEMAAHLTVGLRTEGMAKMTALPDELRTFCPHAERLCHRINQAYGELTELRIKREKTEVFADDYKAMAAILEDALRSPLTEADIPSHADTQADAIHTYLSGLGYDVQGVAVCGTRERHITVRGRGMEQASTHAEEIRTALVEICGVPFTSPTFDHADGITVMHASSCPTLQVAFAGSTVPAHTAKGDVLPPPLTHETPVDAYVPPHICGDHIALFSSDRAYFYALISDGMGSGEEASLTSDIAAVFLKKLLSAGNRPEISIAMLASFLRQKNLGAGSECSATVDLMELDLFGGDALFFKNGATPTYVVRNGEVYKLRSRSLPIGILKDTRPELLRFHTHPGDVVVMVSDGVTHGNDECPWLMDLLSDPLPPNMDTLRADILNRAIALGSPDDLSAIAVRVEEAEAVRVERKTND